MAHGESDIRYALGIDLGGTKIAGAIVSSAGDLSAETRVPTGAEEGAEAVIANLQAAIERLAARAEVDGRDISGIGLAAGGTIDVESGRVIAATGIIPGWTGVNLKEAVGGSVPVYVDNDVNAAAFGEYCFCRSGRPSSLALVAVGTGIGAGLVIDGRVYRGANFMAADFGHVKVVPGGRRCLCGDRGCLEAYGSGWALAGRYRELGGEGPEDMDAGLVLRRAGEGDRAATTVVNEAAACLALALANLIAVIDPEVLVLTGGVIERNPAFRRRLEKSIKGTLRRDHPGRIDIRRSRFGEWAGVAGSAGLVFEERDRG